MTNLIKYTLLMLAALATQLLPAQEEKFRSKAPEGGPAPTIEIGNYEQFTLDNGLQVIVVENHKLPRVSFQLLVDIPPIEQGEFAGTAELAGQMLSRGTENRTKAEVDAAVDFIGADFSTDEDGMFGACLTKHQDQLLEIMSDVLLHPSFAEEEFEKVQKQRLSELSLNQSSADFIASNVGQALRYDDHPYGAIITSKTLSKLTVEKCKSYYEDYFKPNISYLAIVGDIDIKEAKAVAEKYFGEWEQGEIEKDFFQRPSPPENTEVDFVHKDGAVQSVISITYPVNLKPGTEDAIVANVLNTMLGGGMLNSRLNKNIREDKGYSYGVSSTLRNDKHIGYFTAGGSVRNEVTDSAIVEFLSEMNRLREEPVSETELNSVKSYIFGSFARAMERPQTVARLALNTIRYKLPKDYYSTYLKQIDATTVEEVQMAAKKYILPGRAHIVVVGNKQEVADKLKPFSAGGEVKFYDVNGQLIEDAATAIPEGVSAETVIEDYLNAIGGSRQLKEVKDMSIVMNTTVQGMTMQMNMQRKSPDKLLMKVEMNGSTVNETKFDGKQGYVSGMGQKQELQEEDVAEMKAQASIFPELDYLGKDFELELVGIEQVDGNNAYHLLVKTPSGTQQVYYDQQTSLKVKTVVPRTGPGGAETMVITRMSDYREVDGIKVPFEITSEGMAPFPLTMKVESVELNAGLEDSLFEIE